ncbi:aspartyl-phosphate phosphatase Spo0E family protein [Crassaminicella profunda]|uniref:aspartyl-phosphate phosphatase Spo0E family protein n=1 Tax=Crassaminicella profunda TaxID=1286698 RepID=UPI001CA6DAEE|nr:aspartyl-phosphate phosphatase Spo0E family protein [Crassaminicella profunda]QZY57192.1 aspartyl-phosphate phosphatase Spo0E family protein [Crassaminicella profunda]
MSKYDIEKVRTKLNDLIKFGCSYEEIYSVSVELDKLIIAFYKNKKQSMMI